MASRHNTVRSADGTRIGIVIVGSGPAIVVVHGAWNWHQHWLGVAEALAQSHTCWVMDRRARGNSGDGDDYGFEREIDDIEAVLAAAGPEACLVGHSSGAIYALEVARRGEVDRLVLYEPPLRWAERDDPAGLVDRIRALIDDDRAEAAAELFFTEEGRLDEPGLEVLKSQPAWEPMVELAPICLREWDAILGADLTVDRYRDVSTPTLLLAGSDNLDHPSMATASLSATLPDVEVAVLDGHGHTAHLADPELVAERVRGFVAETAA